MIKYKYFIKTEQEFLYEFGERWRHVRYSFDNNMDYLLGQEIDIDTYKEFLDEKGRLPLDSMTELLIPNLEYCTWAISDEMIKEIKVGVDYNQKRILVYD